MTRKQVDIEIAHMLELFQGATAKGAANTGINHPNNYLSKSEKELKNYKIESNKRRRR